MKLYLVKSGDLYWSRDHNWSNAQRDAMRATHTDAKKIAKLVDADRIVRLRERQQARGLHFETALANSKPRGVK